MISPSIVAGFYLTALMPRGTRSAHKGCGLGTDLSFIYRRIPLQGLSISMPVLTLQYVCRTLLLELVATYD